MKYYAYFKVFGQTVTETGPTDMTIVDLDNESSPEVGASILVYISSRNYLPEELPEHALYGLKPVDVFRLMDQVVRTLEAGI